MIRLNVFTTLVPKIEALTKNGLKLEQFTF